MGLEGLWRARRVAAGLAVRRGPVVVRLGRAAVRREQGPQVLGDSVARRALELPGACRARRPLVTTGPYRYVAHPNYVAVVGELVGTAMMFGARSPVR